MAREQEEQGQREGIRDRVEENIKRVQQLQKDAQRIKKGTQAVRSGAMVAQGVAAGVGQVGGAVAAGVGAVAGGIGLAGGIIILLVVFMGALIIILFAGGSQGAGTCYQIQGATCISAFDKCPTGTEPDNGATCNYSLKMETNNLQCCAPEQNCTGTCEAGPSCSSNTEIPDQTALCSVAGKPLCCIPKSSGSDASIVAWAAEIAKGLQNIGCGLNAQLNKSICNTAGYCAMYKTGDPPPNCPQAENDTYYCTDLVIDAYNLAGITNSFSDDVPDMITYWRKQPGFTVLTYNNNASLAQLKAGDVIFFMSNPYAQSSGDHVAVISSVNISCTGSGCTGSVSIYEANSNVASWTFYVVPCGGPGVDCLDTSGMTNTKGQPLQPWFGLNGL